MKAVIALGKPLLHLRFFGQMSQIKAALEGEGGPAQIAREVCTIVTRSGAKIVN